MDGGAVDSAFAASVQRTHSTGLGPQRPTFRAVEQRDGLLGCRPKNRKRMSIPLWRAAGPDRNQAPATVRTAPLRRRIVDAHRKPRSAQSIRRRQEPGGTDGRRPEDWLWNKPDAGRHDES